MVCLLTRVRAFTFAALALATGGATPTSAQTTAPSPAAPPTGGQTDHLGLHAPVSITDAVIGDDGQTCYRYWSANWGHSASHGCLGMTYADSSYLRSWASLGTLVSVH